MNLLSRARATLEVTAGRFEAFLVESADDRTACLDLLDRVRRVELRRSAGTSPLHTSAFGDEVKDELVAVRDRLRGRIIGCVRGIHASTVLRPSAAREYRLDLIPASLIPQVAMAVRMVMEPEYRGSAASLALMQGLYRVGILERGKQVCLVSCEPALVSMYARMGFRPMARAWTKPTGGYRVPMALIGHDAAHLDAVRSPLRGLLRSIEGPWPTEARAWWAALDAPSDCGVRPFRAVDDPRIQELVAGLSERGSQQLLERALEVDTSAGDVLHRAGDGVPGLALVLSGSVSLQREGHPTTRVDAGSLLGADCVTWNGPRPADAVVVEAGRVLLLSRSAVKRVRAPTDRAALWHTLARDLARPVMVEARTA